jgi:hypothetical protein
VGFEGVLWSAIMAQNEAVVAFGADENNDAAVFLLTPVYAIEGDTNCDSVVDVDDLINVILDWGPCAGCNADITRDGIVDVFDLINVIIHWGQTGGAP